VRRSPSSRHRRLLVGLMHLPDRARNIAGRGDAGRPALVHRGRRDKNATRPARGVPENPMKLGFFTMPVHPPARSYVETLKEDREAFILADRLGYTEGYCGERIGDFGPLLYCGKDWG